MQKYRKMKYVNNQGFVFGYAFLSEKEYKNWLVHQKDKDYFVKAYCIIEGIEDFAEYGFVNCYSLWDFNEYYVGNLNHKTHG